MNLDGVLSLGEDVNKVKNPRRLETSEGVVSELLPELELPTPDAELISLKRKWEQAWAKDSASLSKRQKRNEQYWLGTNPTDLRQQAADRPAPDNLIYEALETFLPKATKSTPEPVVYSDGTPEGIALSDTVRKMLAYLADNKNINLRMTIRQMARCNQLYFLGVVKVGWSETNDDISIANIRPQKLILDPDSTVVNGEYTGEFLGEYRKDKASSLVLRFPKKKEFIVELVDGKMGTSVQFIEWWTNDYVFWTLEDEVLGKMKNPHWNYPQERETTDEFGSPAVAEVPGNNHFPIPKKPYVFLSVINSGLKPYDDTNAIEQNLSLQDMIVKRLRQIDKNADNTNSGIIVSGDYFTREQAAQAADALRKGNALWVPRGDINSAVRRDTGPSLAPFVYQSLLDYRGELKNIYGISGYNPEQLSKDRTARGKLISVTQSDDRIGGGFSEYLEQAADRIFNWMLQLIMVYYDEPHTASIVGKERAREYVVLKNTDIDRALVVTVQEGSMIPKDPKSKRDEALQLWAEGAIDPISLFEMMEMPNPREMAKTLFTWQTNPMALFQPEQQPGMMPQGDPRMMPPQQAPVQQPLQQ